MKSHPNNCQLFSRVVLASLVACELVMAHKWESLEHDKYTEYLPENRYLKVQFHHRQFHFNVAETCDVSGASSHMGKVNKETHRTMLIK